MRNLFIIGMLLIGAFMAGWFKINRDGDNTTIEINRSEIRNDTENVLHRGRDYINGLESEHGSPGHLDASSVQPQTGWPQAGWPQEQVAAQVDQWGRQLDSRIQQYIPENVAPNQAQPVPQVPTYPQQQFYAPQR